MRLVMMNADEWAAKGEGDGLGRLKSDHKCAGEAGAAGGGDGVQLRDIELGGLQGGLGDGHEVAQMFAAG